MSMIPTCCLCFPLHLLYYLLGPNGGMIEVACIYALFNTVFFVSWSSPMAWRVSFFYFFLNGIALVAWLFVTT